VAVKKIAVLGAGTMGHGIAHAAMAAGFDTALYDISDAASARGSLPSTR
jgi:3-hydroxybutyryl-CoA dehydrogenase